MNDLTLTKQNGVAYIDSREVAEVIGKNHKDLLRDIRGYIKIMEKSIERNFAPNDFFLESSYVDSIGRTLPCYLLSKMGCEVCSNKLSGAKGVLFTAAYVAVYNRMEAAERAALEELVKKPVHRLGEYNACARIIVRALRNSGAASERIVGFLKNIYEPLGIEVAADDDADGAPRIYTAKQIARMYGVYSHNGNPHYQAVSCIINENLLIGENHKTVTATDYGNHVGISVRYDEYAARAVGEWLCDNGYPAEIYGFARTFYVLYDSLNAKN
jgi:Rha family phage regulatory protein